MNKGNDKRGLLFIGKGRLSKVLHLVGKNKSKPRTKCYVDGCRRRKKGFKVFHGLTPSHK